MDEGRRAGEGRQARTTSPPPSPNRERRSTRRIRDDGRAVTRRSVLVVATVVAAAGVAIGAGLWVAADESERKLRRSTTMTPGEARRLARELVRDVEALKPRLPVLHCKLATPRQRYWCSSARPYTVAGVTADLLRPRRKSPGSICVMKTEKGELWSIEIADRLQCTLLPERAAASRVR